MRVPPGANLDHVVVATTNQYFHELIEQMKRENKPNPWPNKGDHYTWFWVDHPPKIQYKGQPVSFGQGKALEGTDLEAYTLEYTLHWEYHVSPICSCNGFPPEMPRMKRGTCGEASPCADLA